MPADTVVAREQAIEEELSAHFTFRRQLDAQLPQVAADLDAVAAHQFGQRAVDRVRAVPADRSAAPSANVLNVVEIPIRKHLRLRNGVDIVRTKAQRADACGERLLIARVLPCGKAVAE